jgi:predicted ribosome quality control (RQC) complex YloA/Tae2 family protein
MRQIASIELHVLAEELQQIISARFDKFYDLGGGAFKISLRSKGHTVLLYISLLHTINITNFSEESGSATNFAMGIRKRLSGSSVSGISQHGSDRIITIDFEGDKSYRLIIEMFGKGNLILADSSNTIELCYKSVRQKDRIIAVNSQYNFPEGSPIDVWSLNQDSAAAYVKTSLESGSKPVPALSKYFDIGTIYVEEAIYRSGFEPKEELPASCYKEVAASLIGIIATARTPEPTAYMHDGVFVDYSITHLKKYENFEKEKYNSLSELLDNYYLKERSTIAPSAESGEKEATMQSIKKQEEAIAEFEKEEEEYYKIGNAILSNMNIINEVIRYVREHKHADTKDIQENFPGVKIKSFDKAKKELVIEVD